MNQTHLSNYDYKTMPVLLPPAIEQGAIADFLDRSSAECERVVSRLEGECELLTEYRTRLTSDVVTGRLDIRAAAASMPEVADESAPVAIDAEGDDTDIDEEADA
jgi:type I restriction enzyme S subunit